MGIDVKVTVKGAKDTTNAFRGLLTDIRKRQGEDLYQWAKDFLLERIRLNTPIKTGALRASEAVQPPEVRGNRLSLRIGSDLNYALRIHEEEFNLGPISRRQPSQPEGGVGNKYITRTVRYHANTVRRLIGGAIQQSIRKRFASGRVRVLR